MEVQTRRQLYVPDWESIAQAVDKIVAEGAANEEAKVAICNAIADRKVEVRVRVAGGNGSFSAGRVRVPKHLHPAMIDWQSSRPVARWWIDPMLGQHYFVDSAYEQIELLEVRTEDVMSVFGLVNHSANATGLDEAGVEALLRDQLQEKPRLTQAEAVEIAQARGAIPNRKKIREIFNRIDGPQKTGPNGPRSKPAAGAA